MSGKLARSPFFATTRVLPIAAECALLTGLFSSSEVGSEVKETLVSAFGTGWLRYGCDLLGVAEGWWELKPGAWRLEMGAEAVSNTRDQLLT